MRARAILLGLGLALISGVGPAWAGLGIMPKQLEGEAPRSWFVYTLSPGESKEDVLILNNSSEVSQEVVVEALDGLSTEDGVYTLVEDPEQNQHVGTWLDFEQKTLTLRSNSSAEVRFTVKVPSDATVGEHSGGLVAYIRPTETTDGSVPIKTRVGARMYITVPGKVERNIEFKEFKIMRSGQDVEFLIQALNKSNINIAPTVEISLHGLFGGKKVTMDSVRPYMPDANMVFGQKWPYRLWPIGIYKAEAVIHTNAAKEYEMDKSFKELPDQAYSITKMISVGFEWLWLLISLLLLTWIIYRYALYLRALHKYRTHYEVHVAGEGETLKSISQAHSVLAEDIVKFNGVKEKRVLKAGEELLVPIRRLTAAELEAKSKYHRAPSLWRYIIGLR